MEWEELECERLINFTAVQMVVCNIGCNLEGQIFDLGFSSISSMSAKRVITFLSSLGP
jgi:hypothetical protein